MPTATEYKVLLERIQLSENKIEHLDKAIRGNGEIGLNERVGTIESILGRLESSFNVFVANNEKYRLEREKMEAKQNTIPRVSRRTGFKFWMIDKVLPTVVGGILTSIGMIIILVIAVTFSPALQLVIDHAVGK